MPRTIQQKIQKNEQKIAAWIGDLGSKQAILIKRNTACANGNNAESKRHFNFYQKVIRYETKLNDLRSAETEEQNVVLGNKIY